MGYLVKGSAIYLAYAAKIRSPKDSQIRSWLGVLNCRGAWLPRGSADTALWNIQRSPDKYCGALSQTIPRRIMTNQIAVSRRIRSTPLV
jgi:hypothetical protein